MGAIDPIVARNHVKMKSASVEAANNPPNICCSSSTYFCGHNHDDILGIHNSDHAQDDLLLKSSKAKSFLSLPSSGKQLLKPSASTSCLFNPNDDAGDPNKESNTLVCIPTRASLTHEWKKLKTPTKCRECNLFVYFNGRECSFCGFVAHKKCVTVLVIKCSGQQVTSNKNRNQKGSDNEFSKSKNQSQSSLLSSRKAKPSIQPIFGQPVNIASEQVLDFIKRFIYEIDTRGLASKGIYRVSSIKSKVDKLCNYYDQNLSSLVDLSSFHPNIIANALKMYLRQLPEPLLTNELYNEFIEMAKKYSNRSSPQQQQQQPSTNSKKQNQSTGLLSSSLPISTTTRQTRKSSLLTQQQNSMNDPTYDPALIAEFKELVDLLPPTNRELVAIIMRHLRRVSDMSEENQMSAKNLSIIFGPTLLCSNNKSLAIVDNIHQARAVELMITWADHIFPQYANYESKAVIQIDLS